MEPAAANSSEDLEKLRQKLEIREEVLALREKELIPLREEVSTLRVRFWQASAIGAVFLTALTVLGVREWRTLPDTIKSRVAEQVEPIVKKQTLESIRFGEKLQTALYISQATDGSAPHALTMLKRLAAERSQHELLFSYLTECYIRFDKCRDGYRQLKALEKKGLNWEKLEMPETLRNYGFILWVGSLYYDSDESKVDKDVDLLKKSLEEAENLEDKGGIRAAAEMLVLLYLSRGEMRNAKECANEFLKGKKPDWSKYTQKEWFEKLKERRPDIQEHLREMFPGAFTETKPEVKRQ